MSDFLYYPAEVQLRRARLSQEWIMVFRQKKYTIYTLWCLFTAQNRTSHHFFPFTINWLIPHYSAPSCFKFVQINARSWDKSISCSHKIINCLVHSCSNLKLLPLYNIKLFQDLHSEHTLFSIIKWHNIAYFCCFNPITQDCTRPKFP
jgi:hypothetical protein